VILVGRIEAENVHVEAGTLFDHRLPDAAGANDSDGFTCHFVAEERQVGVPVSPLIVTNKMFAAPETPSERAHNEEREFGCGFGENFGRVREGDFVFVGVGPIDVVEAYSDL
jgi:hypothetical protein